MDEVQAVAALLICCVFVAALGSVDFGEILTGVPTESQLRVESGDPEFLMEEIPELRFNVSSIDWGDIEPGGISSRVVLVNNTGALKYGISMAAENFDPSAAQSFLFLSGEPFEISPGETVAASLVLSVSGFAENVTSFSFDVVFVASEVVD